MYRLARLHGENGDRRAWRARLVEAVRLDPTNLRAAGMLAVGSVTGPRAHLRLAELRGRAVRRMRTLGRRSERSE